MWHVSIAGVDELARQKLAFAVLKGIGDASLGQWLDPRPAAFHLRRRVDAQHQISLGEPRDIRNSSEERKILRLLNADLSDDHPLKDRMTDSEGRPVLIVR